MKIKVIVHEAEEGGYWAEVPAIPGCATQGETFEDLLKNLYEAVEGCLACIRSDFGSRRLQPAPAQARRLCHQFKGYLVYKC
jgi:predicted RNase H-like HicB family nuclease